MIRKLWLLTALILIVFVIWFSSEPKVINCEQSLENANLNTDIKVVFSDNVNTKNLSSFIQITPPIKWEGIYYDKTKTLVITPTESLKYNTVYNVKVKKGIKSRLHKKSTSDYSIQIITKDKPALELTLLGDMVIEHLKFNQEKTNYKYPIKNISSDLFNNNKYVIANLESPISNNGTEIMNKAYKFRTPPETIEYLKAMNIDCVSLANNHALDFGPQALLDTIKICSDNNILPYGQNKHDDSTTITNFNGYRIGLCSYLDKIIIPYHHRKLWLGSKANIGVNYISEEMYKHVKELKSQSDIVIVSLHWGVERSKEVTSNQVNIAHKLIDAGADIIVGHHPHVVQGVEMYKNGVIFYSLGNFIFPPTNEYRRSTFIPSIKYLKGELQSIELYPIKPIDGLPYSMSFDETTRFKKEVQHLSKKFGTEVVLKNNVLKLK